MSDYEEFQASDTVIDNETKNSIGRRHSRVLGFSR